MKETQTIFRIFLESKELRYLDLDDVDKDKIRCTKTDSNSAKSSVFNDANVEVDVHFFLGDVILDETWMIPRVKEHLSNVLPLVRFLTS